VKKYVEDIMSELKPNSGSSMKDQVTRLEDKMDKMFDMMITHLENHNK
jgi:ribosome recycling factor